MSEVNDERLDWIVESYGKVIRGHADTTSEDQVATAQTDDIARRMSACWNACKGIPTKTLEYVDREEYNAARRLILDQRNRLLEAMKLIAEGERPDSAAAEIASATIREIELQECPTTKEPQQWNPSPKKSPQSSAPAWPAASTPGASASVKRFTP